MVKGGLEEIVHGGVPEEDHVEEYVSDGLGRNKVGNHGLCKITRNIIIFIMISKKRCTLKFSLKVSLSGFLRLPVENFWL